MDLLRRARRLIEGVTQSPMGGAQPYRVACAEGHVLTGQRTEGYQALRCPTCGEGVFVLPRSPLPDPPRPVSKPDRAREEPDADADLSPDVIELADVPLPPASEGNFEGAEIDWESEVAAQQARDAQPTGNDGRSEPQAAVASGTARPEPPTDRARPERPRPRSAGPKDQPRGKRESAQRPLPVEPAAEPRKVWDADRLRAWSRRHRNLLIFGGAAALLILTVLYRVGQSRREDLPLVVELGRTEGIRALDSGSFDKAHQLLSKAKSAVVALGGAIEGADEVKQAADEAAIFANLTPDSLESILDQAARMEGDRLPDWFSTHYAGRTIIVDATVTAVPAAGGPRGYELDYRVFHGGRGTVPGGVGRLDTTGFSLFTASEPKVGTQVRFGARLESLRFDRTEDVWLFVLEPTSGVSMTHARALEAFGWPVRLPVAPAAGPAQEETP